MDFVPEIVKFKKKKNYKYVFFFFKALNDLYKEKQSVYNELMTKCDEQLKNDRSSSDLDGSSDLQSQLKTLPIR